MREIKRDILLRQLPGKAVSLGECLALWRGTLGAKAILYAPQACVIARLDPETCLLSNPDGSPDHGDIFEARIFCREGEMRWLRMGNLGKASIVGRKGFLQPNDWQVPEERELECLDRKYLVWGQLDTPSQGGWAVSSSARTGPIHLPLESGRVGQGVAFTAREYLGKLDGGHGNMAVLEERLVALEAGDFLEGVK